MAILVLVAFALTAATAQAQQQCKPPKVPYHGQCVHPDAIPKPSVPGPKATPKPKPKPTPKPAVEPKEDTDGRDCKKARTDDTLAAWQDYLTAHPSGSCSQQATARIEELTAAAVAAPKPPLQPTPEPTPAPKPSPEKPPATDKPTSPTTPPSRKTPARSDDPADGAGSSPLRTTGFITLAVGGAVLVAGGVLGGVAAAKTSSIKDQCTDNKCPATLAGDIDTAGTLADASTALLVVGGALAAGGLVTVLLGGGPETEGPTNPGRGLPSTRIAVGPRAVTLLGSF